MPGNDIPDFRWPGALGVELDGDGAHPAAGLGGVRGHADQPDRPRRDSARDHDRAAASA
ncbi:hypothetical protein [Amycolatopsis sp. NPDC051071]|uniref:hypothetical protein n=1 Tax=Amycolatopsis sp. NPDC051071 TaxID=3154637 RepID=UPI00342EBAA6